MPSPKRPPAFQFYADAWLGSVSVETMPAAVEGTYIRLLARQWRTHLAGELLPKDPAILRLLTKLSPAEWKKAWPLLEKHFPVTGEHRANPTLLAVWQDRVDFLESARENGKKGGRPVKEPEPPNPRKAKIKRAETQPFTGVEPNPSPTENPDETSVVCSLSTDTPPPAANAAVAPPAAAAAVRGEAAYAKRFAAIRARFTDERAVLAFERHCRAQKHPDAFLLDLEAAARERPSDGAPGLPWDVIGMALHEIGQKGKVASEFLVRSFAAPLMRPRAVADADTAPEITYDQLIAQMEQEAAAHVA
jgi:uncharacterized protein YdaU (DUF1376 family)